jgi:DNA-binding transcriptional ArsR family regulator
MTDADFLAMARAVADPTRLRMLVALHGRVLCVGQLAHRAGISSSGVTYPVRLMRNAGLVVTLRQGRRTIVRRVERRWVTILTALATAA